MMFGCQQFLSLNTLVCLCVVMCCHVPRDSGGKIFLETKRMSEGGSESAPRPQYRLCRGRGRQHVERAHPLEREESHIYPKQKRILIQTKLKKRKKWSLFPFAAVRPYLPPWVILSRRKMLNLRSIECLKSEICSCPTPTHCRNADDLIVKQPCV